jgi:hypothetical protein
MFYWFKRGAESLRYESREVSSTRFETAEALHEREVALEQELLAQGWVGPHGWNV